MKIFLSILFLIAFVGCSTPTRQRLQSEEPANKLKQGQTKTSDKKAQLDTRKNVQLSNVSAKTPLENTSKKAPLIAKTQITKLETVARTESSKILEKKPIQIMYWGAWEASLLPVLQNGKKLGGLSYMASLVEKQLPSNFLLLATGDLFPGDPQNKKPIVEALNITGLTATTLGNLELNHGIKKLKKKLSKASFQMLSANVYQDEKRIFPAYIIKKIGNLHVGIIGLTSREAAVQAAPEQIAGLTFRDPFLEIGNCLTELKDKVDVTIVLSNMRYQRDEKLARQYPKINIIIGRYEVSVKSLQKRIGPVLICRLNKKRGAQLGEISITREADRWLCQPSRIYEIGPEGKDQYPPSTKAQELIQRWQAREKELAEVICHSDVNLDGDYQQVRQRETNLGNLLADILLASRPGANIAVLNSGSIRASIPKGSITKGMLISTLPYKNHIVEMEVSGDIIRDMLENSVAQYKKISGAFLQIAGFSYHFDPSAAKFSRVKNIKIEGEPLVDSQTYRLVTVDYLAEGGDDYVMLRGQKRLHTSVQSMQKQIENYLRKQKQVHASLEGRIVQVH